VKPGTVAIVERLLLVLGFATMVAAVTMVEWRAGLFFAGLLLVAMTLDLRIGRRT
jgi:hypothetical protein